MSIWQCASNADREVKSSLDTLCLSEADTWSKLSCAMMSQHALQSSQVVALSEAATQRRVQALIQDSERKVNLIKTLTEQLNETKEANVELTVRLQALTKQLEVCEAQNVTLTKEKAGITKELVLSQNTVRKLYKEIQSKKSHPPPPRNLNDIRQQAAANALNVGSRSLLAPPDLWHNEDTRIKVKEPVLPKANAPIVTGTPENHRHASNENVPPSDAQSQVAISDTAAAQLSIEVLVDRDEAAVPRKKADRKGAAAAKATNVSSRSRRHAAQTAEKSTREKAAQAAEDKRSIKRSRQKGSTVS